jgi:site-specific recombinase XerD
VGRADRTRRGRTRRRGVLARYTGRTLDAYRHDLRNLFQWAADHGLLVLEATRAHLEMYRASMEERGLAASTIDRRLSTACSFYRFAHIDGRAAARAVLSSPGRGAWPVG